MHLDLLKKIYIRVISFFFRTAKPRMSIRDLFMWPLASRILGKEYQKIVPLDAGFKIHAYMGDHLGRLSIFYGKKLRYFWEPSTTQLVERLSTEAKSILVAGSHIGLMVLHARSHSDKNTPVHTFEPIRHLYERSILNFNLNTNLGEIHIENMALGDSAGVATMTNDRLRSRILNDNQKTQLETEKVTVTTIDSYIEHEHIKPFDLILLDIEGYEEKALRGMEKLLEKTPPKDLIYEISHPSKDNLDAAYKIQNYLEKFGYRFYIIDDVSDPIYMNLSASENVTLVEAPHVSVYEQFRRRRYFNVYATQRAVSDIPFIAEKQ